MSYVKRLAMFRKAQINDKYIAYIRCSNIKERAKTKALIRIHIISLLKTLESLRCLSSLLLHGKHYSEAPALFLYGIFLRTLSCRIKNSNGKSQIRKVLWTEPQGWIGMSLNAMPDELGSLLSVHGSCLGRNRVSTFFSFFFSFWMVSRVSTRSTIAYRKIS